MFFYFQMEITKNPRKIKLRNHNREMLFVAAEGIRMTLACELNTAASRQSRMP